jgi:outer membrane receptor for ferrienterochelin and colicins
MVDGIPTNASGTPFLILNEIPLDAVERIEIVRGPFSALYGANAFAGVVNVITKSGNGRPAVEGSIETGYPFSVAHALANSSTNAISASVGRTYWNAQLQSAGGNERINYLVSAGYRTIGDYLLRDYAIARNQNTIIKKTNRNYDYRDIRLFGKTGLTIGDRLSIVLHARFFNSNLGFGVTKRLIPDSLDIETKGQKLLIGPTARLRLTDKIDLHAGGYFRRVDGLFLNEDLFGSATYARSSWQSASNDWQVETHLVAQLGENQTMTTGVDVLRNAIDFGAYVNPLTSDTFPGSRAKNSHIDNFGIYLQDEISLLGKLNIVPGIRLDVHSQFGTAVSPKLGASFQLFDWARIRASGGRAFQAPSLSELYMPNLRINPEFMLRSDSTLKPEYLWAADGAIDFTPATNLRLTLGGFYNDMRDLIVPDIDIRSGFVSHRNISQSWSRGIETEAEYQPFQWMGLTFGYVFQQSRDVHSTSLYRKFGNLFGNPKVPLDYIPEHSVNIQFQANRRFGQMRAEGSVLENYTSERKYQEYSEIVGGGIVGGEIIPIPPIYSLKPYWRTDASLKWHFNAHIWAGFFIQNIFNAEYEEASGTLAPGRFATIKVGGNI